MDVEGVAVETTGCPASASSWKKMSIDRLVDAGTGTSCCPGAVRGCFSGFGSHHMEGSMGESCSVGPHSGSAFVVQKPQPRRGFVPVGRRSDRDDVLHFSKGEHVHPSPYTSGLGKGTFEVFGACPSGFPGLSFNASPFSTCGVPPPVSGLWDTCNPSTDHSASFSRIGVGASTGGSIASPSVGTGPSFSMAAMHGSHQHVLPGRYGGVGAAKDWEDDFGDDAAMDGEVSINSMHKTHTRHTLTSPRDGVGYHLFLSLLHSTHCRQMDWIDNLVVLILIVIMWDNSIEGRWTRREHDCFIKGLEKHGEGNWLIIAKEFVPSRTRVQVASHAQKYLRKMREHGHKHGEGEEAEGMMEQQSQPLQDGPR
jgi:SHAQKYF class myb-like DNA-binding protein